MGTHPIFESDFDCLTERSSRIKNANLAREKPRPGRNHQRSPFPCGDDVYAVYQGRPIREGFTCEEFGLTEEAEIELVPRLMGGKVHGSLARAGKVKGQTPKVDAQEKKKA